MDIKEVVFSIHSVKSLGPDRYSRRFFKTSWAKIGPFRTGKMLKQYNVRKLVLLPKEISPSTLANSDQFYAAM